ncbi:MAG: nicotinate (nicotinamide) nucleotide adenylyltransferase [Ferruginibacter sp.]
MNIGLYFGSFNPVHHGHLIIASQIISNSNLHQLWFVVSPQNPLKIRTRMLNENHRLQLIKTAIEGELNLKASNVEFKLPRPSYTIDTLTYLKEKYPQHIFSVIMGSDSFQNLEKWKNFQSLVTNYRIYIYKRPGFDVVNKHNANIIIVEAPLLEISSTHIRELIRKGKSIRYLVPDSVKEEIASNHYYNQKLENPTE